MGKGGEGPQQQGKENKITLEELSQHRTPNDAWMSYRGKVYDVSKWEEHPGVCDKEALKGGLVPFFLCEFNRLSLIYFFPSIPPPFPLAHRWLGDFHPRR